MWGLRGSKLYRHVFVMYVKIMRTPPPYPTKPYKPLHSNAKITKHYENTPIQIYRKISPQKTENFQIKNPDIFHISAQNIDYGYSLEPPRRGGSNEYPQSMFLSRNKKNNVYPCKPQFYYIKVG